MGDLVHGGAKLLGPEWAIHPHGERVEVLERIPERLRRLAGEIAPREIGDGVGQHDRQLDSHLVEYLLDGEARSLGVQRVEDSLDQDRIDATFNQPARLRGISLNQRIETHIAEPWVVYVR